MKSEKALLSVTDAAHRLGIGRSLLYGLLMKGHLASVKVGKRRLVPSSALERYVERLQEDQSVADAAKFREL